MELEMMRQLENKGGASAAKTFNNSMRDFVDLFREHSAARLKEYEAKGFLKYYPTGDNLPPSGGLAGEAK
ncbi:hypothetical protein PR202_ga29200 [Eleusine coracana subsp. coracana]|uniref:Uncharacterized protein n=1 Tax=Eleusine coracana subsp. coracana TaxID=191504 RepID=A0AAV5DKS6_ELECO|nr:hypothetical protein PR202_ga29200 [Eleusine coracana subsp. coracana]